MNYYIKYGNRLYAAETDGTTPLWTTEISKALSYNFKSMAEICLEHIKATQGLYEARVVPESEIGLTVESVP